MTAKYRVLGPGESFIPEVVPGCGFGLTYEQAREFLGLDEQSAEGAEPARGRTFTCALCKGEFTSDPSFGEDARMTEFAAEMPGQGPPAGSVCDDCWHAKVIPILRQQQGQS